MHWWLYPCPQGVPLPLLHSSENYHTSPILCLSPHPVCPISNTLGSHSCLLAVYFYYPLIYTSCKRKKPHKPMHLLRCAWYNTTPDCAPELTQIQLSQKIRSLSKIKPVQQPKSSRQRTSEGTSGSYFSFPTDDREESCWANSLLW